MQFLKRKVSHKCKDVAPFVKSWEPSDPTSGKVKLLKSEVITVPWSINTTCNKPLLSESSSAKGLDLAIRSMKPDSNGQIEKIYPDTRF